MVLAVVRESSDGRDGGMIRVQKKMGKRERDIPGKRRRIDEQPRR